MKLSLELSPSMLGGNLEGKCIKSLVSKALDDTALKKLGWPKKPRNAESASTIAGNKWEEKLWDDCKKNKAYNCIDLDGKKQIDNTLNALRELDSSTGKTVIIYQAPLGANDLFRDKYLSGITGGTKVTFSKMFADFIMAEYMPNEGKFRLTVLDSKNSEHVKGGAEVQIAFYVLILKYLLKEHKDINCYMNEETGIVWNKEKITKNCLSHEFGLEEAIKEIETFFAETLPGICSTVDSCRDAAELDEKLGIKISQSCEYCFRFENCCDNCRKNRSARLLPYIRPEAQNRLDELIESGDLKDDSIDSVKALLSTDPDKLTYNCFYWNNIKNDIEAYTKGLEEYFNNPECKMPDPKAKPDAKLLRFPKKGTSLSMPCGQDYALFLTAQQDVDSGRVYAYAWRLKPGKERDPFGEGLTNGYVMIPFTKSSKYCGAAIAEKNDKEEFDRIDKVFVEAVYTYLETIHKENKKIIEHPDYVNNAEWYKKIASLQCYVMDDYERTNINNSLLYMLQNIDPSESDDNKELLDKVLAILFFLQNEQLLTDSKMQPKKVVENPMTVLTTEISRLYVLPRGISYNFRSVAELFNHYSKNDKGNNTLDYLGKSWFKDEDGKKGIIPLFGKLTNVVDGIPIVRMWNGEFEKKNTLDQLAKHLNSRLAVENDIVQTIQYKDKKTTKLSRWPSKFFKEEQVYPDDPEAAKLYFECLLEEQLKYQGLRASRAAGIDNALDKGAILSLEYTGRGNTYSVINRESCIGRDWFSACFCEDTPENRLKLMTLNDKRMDLFNDEGSYDGWCYTVDTKDGFSFTDDGSVTTVDISLKAEGFEPENAPQKYLLFEVYRDFNSGKTLKGISKLADPELNFKRLLDPKKLSESTGISYDDDSVKLICKKYSNINSRNFSPSQENAFKHLLENKLTVLVGPPASGKTDFIARSLITLSGYYKEAHKKNLKILVTAMSHSAIDNVLLKLQSMLSTDDIEIYKVDKFDNPADFVGLSNVSLIEREDAVKQLKKKDRILIFGMTAWAAHKVLHRGDKMLKKGIFDVIVTDEASQVRAMDAFLCLECSDERTRFLLVGDDDQLPPIISGKYKEKPGEKYIYGSIFHMYLTGLGEGHKDIVQLSDNFRMNNILCRYPSIMLYGPDYKATMPHIKDQKISLRSDSGDPLLDHMLDPEYPLVFCKLSGNPRQQIEAEREIVKKLVHVLWDNLENDDHTLAKDEGNFWRDANGYDGGFGIISPHHEHINRLKTDIFNDLRSIAPDLKRDDIYIGTVDKLQGKERKAVIVSYGVSEQEKIMQESEFIFSSNRLNVSLTRGKAKTIVFLSDVIAESTLSTNVLKANDEAIRKGIDFVKSFAKYMKSYTLYGDRKITDLDAVYAEEEMQEETFTYNSITLNIWKKHL